MSAADEDVKLTEALFAHVTEDPQLTWGLEQHWRGALEGGRIEGASTCSFTPASSSSAISGPAWRGCGHAAR